jgi:N-acetyl-1-D-myo-inositol-2-amino-2-deoxy-alpha-D-glucopyranoside deacetylase
VTPVPHDLLLILAHPDDESFLAAGTVARLADAGRPAGLVCATRGEAGALGDPPLATRDTIGRVREGELRDACAVLGMTLVALLDYEDRRLAEADPAEVRSTLVTLLRRERPRVVVTFDPNGVNGHPDHVAVSRFALDAVVAAADARWSPELGPAHRVRRVVWSSPVYPWQEWRPERLAAAGGVDYLVDTRAQAPRREAALAAHRTQGPRSVRPNWYDAAERSGAGRRVFDVEAFRHGWGEPPPTIPAADLFDGLDG